MNSFHAKTARARTSTARARSARDNENRRLARTPKAAGGRRQRYESGRQGAIRTNRAKLSYASADCGSGPKQGFEHVLFASGEHAAG
eukprot:1781766-Pleurochrysis_carterae.AAC.2